MLRQKYRKGIKASAFIRKLHSMVQQQQSGGLIGWGHDGGFAVKQVALFSTTLLPRYFKHKNYASFLRQLNMYNFTKLRTDDQSLQLFHHPLFLRDRPELHKQISRREQGRREDGGQGEGKAGLGERIADLGRQQEELMEQCSQLISDNADIMDDNFILKATIGDETLNHRIILETITSFLRAYHPSACPTSQQTHISSLLDTLERTHGEETLWAGKWEGALRNFISMVEHNELRSVLKWINASMSIGTDKKKKNSFTIVGQEERLTLPTTAFFADF